MSRMLLLSDSCGYDQLLLKLLVPQGVFILDLPHCRVHWDKHSFPQCGEQGEGILLTCDSDSMLNQGQRAGENKESAKNFTALTFRLCCSGQQVQDNYSSSTLEKKILYNISSISFICIDFFLEYKTHILCLIWCHSKDHVWQCQMMRGGIKILFPKGFSMCKCNSFNIPPPRCRLSSSPMDLFQNPSQHWTHSPRHCCHGGHLNIKFPLLLIWLQALWTAHFIMAPKPD